MYIHTYNVFYAKVGGHGLETAWTKIPTDWGRESTWSIVWVFSKSRM